MSKLLMNNPATGESLGEIKEASLEEIALARKNANDAFKKWSALTLKQRLYYMKCLKKYLIEKGEELSKEISKDTGKAAFEAYSTEIFPTIDAVDYYIRNSYKILRPEKVKTPLFFIGKKSYKVYKPIGVVAVISPWNYPFQLSLVPVVSALVCGNTVILKPSEFTAYTGLLIEKMFKDVGFPEGVIQVLHGAKDVGQGLIDSVPDKIFFTGSVATGKRIMAEASKNLIPVELELGGKDPMIVFEDANIERAVNGATWGAFSNSGQTCMAVERVYVQNTIYEEFLGRLMEKTKKLRQGYGEDIDIGSMTSPLQVDIVKSHLEEAVAQGAKIVCGGELKDGSNFISPTIITEVNHSMKIVMEETFGPMLPVMSFKTAEEAVRLANDSPFGLNASVWSSNMERAKRVAMQIESGNVCINDVIISVANMNLPFGGVKQSGIGRYHGKEGLYTFCHTVSILVDRGKKNSEINWYPYSRRKLKFLVGLAKLMYGKRIR